MSTQQHDGGKSHKKRKIKQKPVLEQVPAVQQQQQQEDGNSKFARALGSTDYATREKGLQALSRFLVHKDSMSELDMMKLWKGLFFCFWHSDKAPVQAELAERLAGLLQQMRPAMAQLYWAGLLATLRREWFAMDRHRLDKFLMLTRKFVAALLARLADGQWDPAAISSLTLQLPLQQQLIPPSSSKSLGLSYHLADVWLQELKRLPAQQQQALSQQALLQLLEPFVAVLEAAGEQPLLARIKEAVFDVLVSDITAAAAAAGAGNDSDSDDEEQDSLAYCAQLDAAQLAALLFERGAAEGVRSRNRQVLYSISKELERAAGKRRKLAAAAAVADEEQQQQQQQPASEKKKKKRQQQDAEQQQQQLEVEQEQQHQTLSSKKKKKKQEQQEQQQPLQELQLQQEQQQQQQPPANGVTPKSKKKHKQQQEPLQNGQATVSTPVAAAAAAATETPQPAAKPSSSKKKRKHGEATPAAADVMTPPPAAAAAAKTPGGAGLLSTAKKGVVIDLKKNIYFAHGAPVPPADLRSPPATKPKGSALKKSGGSVLGKLGSSSRSGGSPHAPATAPAKQQQGSRLPQQQQQPGSARKAVTPNSVPRVKASAFF
uniref:Uncharacterized protein n=1 Tax=Tetradesmus obliquus TaxID=3088 RepID=A0A383VAX4_TETOB|eukprot:jgi/Sobl393_1/13765/SZX61764.1